MSIQEANNAHEDSQFYAHLPHLCQMQEHSGWPDDAAAAYQGAPLYCSSSPFEYAEWDEQGDLVRPQLARLM